jgi:hypothetical protein
VLLRFGDDAAASGFRPSGLIGSPITGADGNREFLALLEIGEGASSDWAALVDGVVPSAA